MRKWQEECGYPFSEFAILYPMHFYRGETEIDLPQSIQTALDSSGVLWRWASEDSRSKRDCDISVDSVTVSTVHSVNSLCYVAITRARTRLYVPYVREGWVIGGMSG